MKTIVTLFALAAGAAAPHLCAQPLSADDLAAKSQQAFYYAGDDMSARVVMTLIAAGGRQRVRDMTMLRRNAGAASTPSAAGAEGRQKYFLFFHSPTDVRGTAFLVSKEPGRDADRWLFVPALNLVQRIAARDAESSFVGSDFSYEDLSGRPLAADTRRLLREESLDGKPCHVIESVPKGRAGFTRKLAWIDRTTFLPLKEEYYDAQKQLSRVFTADEVRDADGVPTVVKRTMKNVKSGHRTEVVFREVRYRVGLTDEVFTERSLRRPPAPWISGQ
ncbi:MAG: outer membrane lipoprotein-sorting protein [Opitutaceae bacterium]|nr:outer membrane lipoprotein-sorting protein [Opitutaceae bacterium]